MKNKSMVASGLLAASVLLGAFVLTYQSPVKKSEQPVSSTVAPDAKPAVQLAEQSPVPTAVPEVQTEPVKLIPLPQPSVASAVAVQPAPKAPRTKPAIQDPVARLALSQVGADPEAEAYWVQAINDPSLPDEERKDLIEDLNEDGLANPHHPTAEDMPLIARRIQLIEELGPFAMDRVNDRAFGEAYKDLVNLYNGLPAN